MIDKLRGMWRRRGQMAMVDAYFRGSLYFFPWLPVLSGLTLVMSNADRSALSATVAVVTMGLMVTQGMLAVSLLNRALNRYLERGATPCTLLLASGVLTLVTEFALYALIRVDGPVDKDALSAAALAIGATLTPFFMALSLVVSKRKFLAVPAGGAVVCMTARYLLTGSWPGALGLASMVLFAGTWSFVLARPTGWMLSVIGKLDAARHTEARLAVAEERLRFSRDLHDVMGRNLAVIALKGELAVQLARRERPEAVEQMVEVQRIAQEAQREVREVVRGYRKADLQSELAGARSVLRAAGVDCRIEGEEGAPLPPEVESALGWVVREGTTNVLRHAVAAQSCAVRTRIDPGRSVLVMTMENDGVAPSPDEAAGGPGPGNGLKGLRERLRPLGGSLTSGLVPNGGYRLTVELPVGAARG
ncbi:sensor histidine kinase [Streptomyces sp. NPDC058773]|uniref:sensor histidine kinase n=1 Tax=Streptomyces sp. NPDC058773 TaxID=3346632 RepID=UPI003684D640